MASGAGEEGGGGSVGGGELWLCRLGEERISGVWAVVEGKWVLPAAEGKKMREKNKGRGPAVLASGEEDSGRKIQTSRGGGCLQRDRVRFRVCFFFLYFSDVSKLPPLKKSV